MIILYAISLSIILWLFSASIADARKVTPTCANVRCASGTCIDTPDGAVCTNQQLTCASTLCAQGNICVESQTGPQCVPQNYPPGPVVQPPQYTPTPPTYYGQYYYPYYQPQYYQGRPRYYRSWRYSLPSYNWGGYGWYQRPQPPVRTPPRTDTPPQDQIICPMVYQPVCAEKRVQCVTYPCPPIRKTFGNSCEASREDYIVIYEEVCR